jgi:segregation and condensation protein A
MPQDLYIPPDALEVFLEAFEGPLDLLLYLIRKQNFNILDIPLASVTRQYLDYVDQIRKHNLELASEYLLMAAMLIEIKSRMLLPPKKSATAASPKTRVPNWCAAWSNTSRSSWPRPSSTRCRCWAATSCARR